MQQCPSMRAVLAALLVSTVAHLAAPPPAIAEDGGATAGPHLAETTAPVIGGTSAPAGKWPDAAAVNFAGEQECTGTLIAPTIVLTAGHCIENPSEPSSVVVGTSSLARLAEGEVLPVIKRIEYPSSWTSYDVGVLVLGSPSRFPPRAIATGWASLEIQNGAAVAIVGYGAIDRDASQFTSDLQEAMTTITDAGCTTRPGCNTAALPNGELGAGGGGIDTCPGDSGGPLYSVTSFGTFLAGVTSRSYDDYTYYCSEGGIYVRPDKIVAWIEEVAGVPVGRGPEPTLDAPLAAVKGHAAEAQLTANDPIGEGHTFAITTPPAAGSAAIRADGLLRVCAGPTAGADTIGVTITDKANPARALTVTLPVTIAEGEAGADCDPADFQISDEGGCCEAGRGAGGSLPLALGVLVALRRRRRAA